MSEIASTTKLLSFNASIEAKRAGEAGAPFSIIAHEIKELSDNSAEAEDRMEELVTGNNQMTNKAVEKLDSIKRLLVQITDTVKKLADNE